MITNPNWHKPKIKPYLHQISLDYIEKLVECMDSIDIEEMDCNTCLKMQEILTDEFEDPEFLAFAIENYSELFSYIASGSVNIRIYREEGQPNNPSGKQEVVCGRVDMRVNLVILVSLKELN